MKNLTKYILESLIIEGGHSIENAQSIRGDLALKVANEIIDILKETFNNIKFSPIGSTGKKSNKEYSGDIDIAIEDSWDNYNKYLDFIKNKFNPILGNINNNLNVFNIGYKYLDNNVEKIVQVDFMFVDDIEYAKFIYHSPNYIKHESEYKGKFRSELLQCIFTCTPPEKTLSKDYEPEYFTNEYNGEYEGEIKSYWKYNLSQSQGLRVIQKSYEGKSRPLKTPKNIKYINISKNVNYILKLGLGDNATSDDTNSFESLINFICSSKYKFYSKEQLNNIYDTFIDSKQLKVNTDEKTLSLVHKYFKEKIDNI